LEYKLKESNMNRRGFLKFLGMTPAVALPIPNVVTKLVTDKPYDYGASFAVNLEKETYKYVSRGIITTGSFAKALWPGIQKWYGEEYGKIK
jgi:hypothetical protein